MPYEDSVGALKELQDEGKIRQIGISNVSLAELEQARRVVEVVTVQNRYNLTDRHGEDVLQACEEARIGFIPWFPLATGRLAESGGPLDRIAGEHEATPAQIALAWLLATLAGDAADPGHVLDRASGGELRGHADQAHARGG